MVSAGLGTRNDLVTMIRKIMREVEKKTTQACISKYSNKDRFQLLTLLACPQHCTAIIYTETQKQIEAFVSVTEFCCLCGKELSHQILSLCFELYSVLTSMTALISFASRLASSSMSLPSFKVFSICRLPLSIASFFFCSIQRKQYYTSIWVKPVSTVGSYFPRAV